MTTTQLYPTLDVEMSGVRLAIFWKALGELDIYSENSVKTIHGSHAEIIAGVLKSNKISVEEMD